MFELELIKLEDLWYAIGYITADGNLSPDGRHVVITSKDIEHLEKIKEALSLKGKIGRKSRAQEKDKRYGLITISSVAFYRYLLQIGLTPNKSHTLGEIEVPAGYFRDFLRGVIDGDGCIRTWLHPQNGGEQWELRIFSGAPKFAQWLYREIQQQFLVGGTMLYNKPKPPRAPLYIIKFGKMAAQRILAECYDPTTLSLTRKATIAQKCLEAKQGWKRSFTINRIV